MSVLKNVRIRGFSGPYFLAFGLNTDQKGSKYRYSLRSEIKLVIHSFYLLEMLRVILSFLKILSLKKRFNRFFSIQKICKKSKCRSFPLRISSVNVTKSAENCGFGHIYWRNLNGKLHFLCSVRNYTRGHLKSVSLAWFHFSPHSLLSNSVCFTLSPRLCYSLKTRNYRMIESKILWICGSFSV